MLFIAKLSIETVKIGKFSEHGRGKERFMDEMIDFVSGTLQFIETHKA